MYMIITVTNEALQDTNAALEDQTKLHRILETYVHTNAALCCFGRNLLILGRRLPIFSSAAPQMHVWENVLNVGVIF